MSDLISRLSLKDRASEYALSADEYKRFCKIIDTEPTAYNVDRVIEELYEERTEILLSNDYECEIINYCLDNFDNAIEIVKEGGKNE